MDLPEGFKSGLTRFGLGLAALGRPGYINLGHAADLNGRYHPSDMERQTHQVIDLAVQLGVKYIDVAQSYGRGEEFLSSWLRNHRPEDLWVGSKWGYYYTADWQVNAKKHEIKDHSVELLSRQWPESETRLKPYLKLYQVHSATLESGVLQNTKVLEELARIKAGGYVIGLSLSGEQQAEVLRKALDIKVDEDTLFGSVQATYNLLEQSVTPALEEAHDRGLAIIAKETLANGRLTTRNKGAAYFEVLQAMASKYKTTIDALSLAFVLEKKFITTVLSGAATEEQLISNLKSRELDLESTDLRQLGNLQMPSDTYWNERAGLAWN